MGSDRNPPAVVTATSPGGEIEFTDEELDELELDVADGGRRRKRSVLRVPLDEVPRNASPSSAFPALRPTSSVTVEGGLPISTLRMPRFAPTDLVVETAFDKLNGAGQRPKSMPPPSPPEAMRTSPGFDMPPPPDDDDDSEAEASVEVTVEAAWDSDEVELDGASDDLPSDKTTVSLAPAPADSSGVPESIDDAPTAKLTASHLGPSRMEALAPMLSSETGLPAAAGPVAAAAPPPLPAPDDDAVVSSSSSPDRSGPRVLVRDGAGGRTTLGGVVQARSDEVDTKAIPVQRAEAGAVTLPPPIPASPPPLPPAPPLVVVPASPALSMAPPPVPALAPAPVPSNEDTRPRRKRRAKQWFEEIFDEDYLRTLPFMTPRQTERDTAFILEALGIQASASLLDVGCGYGRHAMELSARGHNVTGLDLSLPLLIRAADAARRVGVHVNFVHADMREMAFNAEFDAAYCFFTTFGYFDDDTNRKVAAAIAKSLKPGGRLLLDVVNRDYLIGDLPTRVWWQGEGCVVLEEVDFNYFTSRLQVQRSIVFEDGRQVEQEISIRAYSLHEIGKVLHHAGFRVIEVSGGLGLRGKFFGSASRQILVVAEKRVEP